MTSPSNELSMVSDLASGWRRSARTQFVLQQINAKPLATLILCTAAIFGGPILFLSGSFAIGVFAWQEMSVHWLLQSANNESARRPMGCKR